MPIFCTAKAWEEYGIDYAVHKSLWRNCILATLGPQPDKGTVARDLSGRGNSGSLINGPVWGNATYRGQTWRGSLFSGTSFVLVDRPIIPAYPFTMASWGTVCTGSTTNIGWISYANGAASATRLCLGTNTRYPEIYCNAGSPNDKSATQLAEGSFHHLAAVFASATLRYLYVDGALAATGTASCAFDAYYTRLGLGCYIDSSISQHEQGWLTSAFVWTRVLTPAEILTPARGPMTPYEVRLPEYFTFTGAPGTDYTETINDELGLVDAAARVAEFVRVKADVLGLADAASRTAGFSRTAADNLGLTDSESNIAEYSRSADDTEGVADAADRVVEYSRTSSDAEGLTDSTGTSTEYARVAAEAVGLGDLASHVTEFARTASDAEGIADACARIAEYARTETDTEGLGDVATRVADFSRTLSDSEGLTDASSYSMGFYRTVTDSEGLADTVSRIAAFSRTASDNEGLTDLAARTVTYVRTCADSEGLADTASVTSLCETTIVIIRVTLETLTRPGAFLESLTPILVSNESLTTYSLTESLVDAN